MERAPTIEEWEAAAADPFGVHTPRNMELAIKEIAECLRKQLPQGVENAARHIAACLDEFGRE